MIVLPIHNIERNTAGIAARRELRVIGAALASASPGEALCAGLQQHAVWMQHLLGCRSEQARLYIAWRLEMVRRFGMMTDAAFLLDAEECLMQIIRGGICHAA